MPTFEPRRPFGPRDPNDGWVDGPAGRFWGRGGAAGLLAHDPARGVLLQHRVAWSDQGGTWGLPGGARHAGESAIDGALREAQEEAGVVTDALSLRFTYTFDVGYWSYTTVGAEVTAPFVAMITDPESVELRWVPPADIQELPLHPGFGVAWPALRELLERPSILVIDAADVAEVADSRPDEGRADCAVAGARLIDRLGRLQHGGVPGAWFGLDDVWRVWPQVVVVVEEEAESSRGATRSPSGERLVLVPAGQDGDSAVVEQVAARSVNEVTVVTSDCLLRGRVQQRGARTIGPATLLALLGL